MDTMDYAERLNGHSHSYGQPVFTWSEDLTSCTAVWSCSTGDAVVKKECTVSSGQTREPDCTQEGEITHVAVSKLNGKRYTDTNTTSVAALGHACSDPSFFWSDDLSACTAKAACERCGEMVETPCTVSRNVVPASCLEPGSVLRGNLYKLSTDAKKPHCGSLFPAAFADGDPYGDRSMGEFEFVSY